jgi:hypothetical protein
MVKNLGDGGGWFELMLPTIMTRPGCGRRPPVIVPFRSGVRAELTPR